MMSAPHRSNHRPGNGDPCHAASRWPSGRLGVEEDEEEKPSNKAEPAAHPKDSKVEQLCDWMAAHCGLDSKAVAKYAEALVGEGVDQPSDLADVDDADWPSSIKTLHLKKIKAAVAKGDFDVLEPEGAMDQDDEVSPTRPHSVRGRAHVLPLPRRCVMARPSLMMPSRLTRSSLTRS